MSENGQLDQIHRGGERSGTKTIMYYYFPTSHFRYSNRFSRHSLEWIRMQRRRRRRRSYCQLFMEYHVRAYTPTSILRTLMNRIYGSVCYTHTAHDCKCTYERAKRTQSALRGWKEFFPPSLSRRIVRKSGTKIGFLSSERNLVSRGSRLVGLFSPRQS